MTRPGLLVCLLTMTLSHPAAGSVLTRTLLWQEGSIESGLARLKEQFLDISSRQDVEFVGGVFRTGSGHYRFTEGRGRPGQDQVTFRIQPSADAELVGFWHTHGAGGPTRDLFSGTDAELVRSFRLPFYLITPDGEIRVLRPEHVDNPERTRIRGMPRGARPGERLLGKPARCPSGVMEV